MTEPFNGVTRVEYTVDELGLKTPYSDFDRPPEYFERIEMPTVGDYRDMLRFKDRTTALFDKRWKAAQAVIDLIAAELGLESDVTYYCAKQNLDTGEMKSPIIDRLREWSSNAGDKTQTRMRIKELENQVDVLKSLLREQGG